MREGLGCKAALFGGGDDDEVRADLFSAAAEAPDERWARPAAGMRSHAVDAHRVPACGRHAYNEEEASSQRGAAAEPRQVVDHLRSEKVGPIVAWEPVDDDEEEELESELNRMWGHKGRSGHADDAGSGVALKHRGIFDPQEGQAAGRCTAAPATPGKRSVSPRRLPADAAGQVTPTKGGMADLLRHSLEAELERARPGRKQSAFSECSSTVNDKASVRNYNQMFRYEHWQPSSKVRGTPPASEAACDFISANGVPHTSARKRIDQPQLQLRDPVGDVMRFDKVSEQREAQRVDRLANDTQFADLVAQTRAQAQATRDEKQAVKERLHSGNSRQTAALLQWDA